MTLANAKAVVVELRRMLEDSQFLYECSRRLSRPQAEVAARIQTALGEAVVGLQLLQGLDLAGKRVLEVGAGIGIVSLALHRCGIDIVAIEPGLGGFDQNALIGSYLREKVGDANFPYLSLSAADLRPNANGMFDVQFSVNVLEHIPNLEAAVAGMCGVLKPGGVMRHTCPNYLIPYEPHFGIPLVPFLPRTTAWLVPSIGRTELWRSLNFVTLRRMKRALSRHGLSCTFTSGTMYEAFARLDRDQEFRKRQGRGVVATAYRLLSRLGLLRMIASLPPLLATPMTFEARRAS